MYPHATSDIHWGKEKTGKQIKGVPRPITAKSLCAREIISAAYGEAENRPPPADGKGVKLMLKHKLPPTGGAVAKARSAEHCAPAT